MQRKTKHTIKFLVIFTNKSPNLQKVVIISSLLASVASRVSQPYWPAFARGGVEVWSVAWFIQEAADDMGLLLWHIYTVINA